VKTSLTRATALLSTIVLSLAVSAGQAQATSHESSSADNATYIEPSASAAPAPALNTAQVVQSPVTRRHPVEPFSRIAIGADISPLGVGAEVAVPVNYHLDVRATGSIFSYNTNFSTQGFNVDADVRLASAGIGVDYYPFHNGFRLSPGLLFYNQNRVNASAPVTPGTSFQLNDQTFYAATPNSALGITALSGTGALGLHPTRPAFTATTGWGSLIPRNGRHWAIPFEIGAAFTGAPTVKMNLTGWACYDQAQTLCTNVNDPTNPISVEIQNDLQAQVAKWRSDLDPLKVYPIISTGIVFNFNIR
jgi:hypothetical protein